jgi:rhamnosyltransferase
VHHSQEPWLFEAFGTAGGEGRSFVLSELQYLFGCAPHLIPEAAVRNLSKWLAYRLGLREHLLPLMVKRLLSRQPNFWDRESSRRRQIPIGELRIHSADLRRESNQLRKSKPSPLDPSTASSTTLGTGTE